MSNEILEWAEKYVDDNHITPYDMTRIVVSFNTVQPLEIEVLNTLLEDVVEGWGSPRNFDLKKEGVFKASQNILKLAKLIEEEMYPQQEAV